MGGIVRSIRGSVRRFLRSAVVWPIYRRFEQEFHQEYFKTRFQQWSRQLPDGVFNDYPNPNPSYQERFKLHEHVLKAENLADRPITYLEFGVAAGESIKWWLAHNRAPESSFTGFDCFEGLPEDWDHKAKGDFSTGGKTPVVNDSRCGFVVGIFQDTLQGFLKSRDKQEFRRPLVVHLDADIYSATLFVMFTLLPHLRKGDILIFDEFSSPLGEFKAFVDFELATGIKWRLIGAVNNYRQIAIGIEEIPGSVATQA